VPYVDSGERKQVLKQWAETVTSSQFRADGLEKNLSIDLDKSAIVNYSSRVATYHNVIRSSDLEVTLATFARWPARDGWFTVSMPVSIFQPNAKQRSPAGVGGHLQTEICHNHNKSIQVTPHLGFWGAPLTLPVFGHQSRLTLPQGK
jgi:hypothetical protein